MSIEHTLYKFSKTLSGFTENHFKDLLDKLKNKKFSPVMSDGLLDVIQREFIVFDLDFEATLKQQVREIPTDKLNELQKKVIENLMGVLCVRIIDGSYTVVMRAIDKNFVDAFEYHWDYQRGIILLREDSLHVPV